MKFSIIASLHTLEMVVMYGHRTQGRIQGGAMGAMPPPPPKFIRSKIFWVNLWQLYYSCSTVFKFCTSMWLFSALAPALYKGCGLLAAIIFFSVKLIWQ